jgi:hypothetical protein
MHVYEDQMRHTWSQQRPMWKDRGPGAPSLGGNKSYPILPRVEITSTETWKRETEERDYRETSF